MVALVQIRDTTTRVRAKHWVDIAPDGCVITFRKPTRTTAQNAKLWAMINDVRLQRQLGGLPRSADYWKCVFMKACDHEATFGIGLDGDPFPMGFRSSQLSVGQMADLITFIQQWGDETGLQWSDDARAIL